MIDNATDYCWSFFLKKKLQTSAKVRELIKDLKSKLGITVKHIRCDNAGENKNLQRNSLRDGLGLTFEFTAPGTPQQQGRMERKFATFYGRMRAMMKRAGLNEKQRQSLWTEVANTANDLENVLVSPLQTKPAHESFYRTRF